MLTKWFRPSAVIRSITLGVQLKARTSALARAEERHRAAMHDLARIARSLGVQANEGAIASIQAVEKLQQLQPGTLVTLEFVTHMLESRHGDGRTTLHECYPEDAGAFAVYRRRIFCLVDAKSSNEARLGAWSRTR
jgi:hypothetical protein